MSEDDEWDFIEKIIEMKHAKRPLPEEPKPAAWRRKVGHQWHYFDESSSFPLDDLEPLYTKEQLK
jgi:hypothetical protein